MIITRTPAVTAARAARLERAKAEAVEAINTAIGAARARHITVIPAQDMIYMAKEAQARAYLASEDPDDAPLLAVEIGITAPTLYEVAQTVINLADIWRTLAVMLEGLRLGAITAVNAATDIPDTHVVLDALRATLASASDDPSNVSSLR